MPVRTAVLCDNRSLCTAWLDAINADASFAATAFPSEFGLRPLRASKQHLVVIDMAMAEGLELCAKLTISPLPRVVCANVADEDDDSGLNALSAGGRGIVYRAAPVDDIVKALHVVHGGQVWAPRHVVLATWMRLKTEVDSRGVGDTTLAERLSHREREVFQHAAIGLGNKEVAKRLSISEATVKVHLTHIFQKLGLRGRGELAAAYHGILRQTLHHQ